MSRNRLILIVKTVSLLGLVAIVISSIDEPVQIDTTNYIESSDGQQVLLAQNPSKSNFNDGIEPLQEIENVTTYEHFVSNGKIDDKQISSSIGEIDWALSKQLNAKIKDDENFDFNDVFKEYLISVATENASATDLKSTFKKIELEKGYIYLYPDDFLGVDAKAKVSNIRISRATCNSSSINDLVSAANKITYNVSGNMDVLSQYYSEYVVINNGDILEIVNLSISISI